MSSQEVRWAIQLRLPARNASTKAVLLVMAYLARKSRRGRLECFPSVGYLVGATGLNRKTVIAAMRKLRRWGLVSDTGQRMGVTRQVVVYALHMRKKVSTRCPQNGGGGQKTSPKTTDNDPKNDAKEAQTRDTNQLISIKLKSLARARVRAPAPRPAADQRARAIYPQGANGHVRTRDADTWSIARWRPTHGGAA